MGFFKLFKRKAKSAPTSPSNEARKTTVETLQKQNQQLHQQQQQQTAAKLVKSPSTTTALLLGKVSPPSLALKLSPVSGALGLHKLTSAESSPQNGDNSQRALSPLIHSHPRSNSRRSGASSRRSHHLLSPASGRSHFEEEESMSAEAKAKAVAKAAAKPTIEVDQFSLLMVQDIVSRLGKVQNLPCMYEEETLSSPLEDLVLLRILPQIFDDLVLGQHVTNPSTAIKAKSKIRPQATNEGISLSPDGGDVRNKFSTESLDGSETEFDCEGLSLAAFLQFTMDVYDVLHNEAVICALALLKRLKTELGFPVTVRNAGLLFFLGCSLSSKMLRDQSRSQTVLRNQVFAAGLGVPCVIFGDLEFRMWRILNWNAHVTHTEFLGQITSIISLFHSRNLVSHPALLSLFLKLATPGQD